MSNDWQPGDLALCVNAEGFVSVGGLYTVNEVFDGFTPWGDDDDGLALTFVSIPDPVHPIYGEADGYDAWRFIKVTLPEADEFDREVIDLMNQRERVA